MNTMLYLFIYFYVVLRIEPRLHTCEGSALPLSHNPGPHFFHFLKNFFVVVDGNHAFNFLCGAKD